jgi:hypothetical protein
VRASDQPRRCLTHPRTRARGVTWRAHWGCAGSTSSSSPSSMSTQTTRNGTRVLPSLASSLRSASPLSLTHALRYAEAEARTDACTGAGVLYSAIFGEDFLGVSDKLRLEEARSPRTDDDDRNPLVSALH